MYREEMGFVLHGETIVLRHDQKAPYPEESFPPHSSVRRVNTHFHTCLECDAVIGEGNDCEVDADHDFALCSRCS